MDQSKILPYKAKLFFISFAGIFLCVFTFQKKIFDSFTIRYIDKFWSENMFFIQQIKWELTKGYLTLFS